jgi:hypothetical protein
MSDWKQRSAEAGWGHNKPQPRKITEAEEEKALRVKYQGLCYDAMNVLDSVLGGEPTTIETFQDRLKEAVEKFPLRKLTRKDFDAAMEAYNKAESWQEEEATLNKHFNLEIVSDSDSIRRAKKLLDFALKEMQFLSNGYVKNVSDARDLLDECS